jgi:hypothetical protein
MRMEFFFVFNFSSRSFHDTKVNITGMIEMRIDFFYFFLKLSSQLSQLSQVESVTNGGTKQKVDLYSHDLVLNR